MEGGRTQYLGTVVVGQVFDKANWSCNHAILQCVTIAFMLTVRLVLCHDKLATPQPGGYGWITSDLSGPFKGRSGNRFWYCFSCIGQERLAQWQIALAQVDETLS
jgi:hypothetical protein